VAVDRRPAEARARGGLEQEILAALGAAGEPMTPAQVRDALDGSLAYTTVMTVLSRLHSKGIVTRRKSGRAYAYAAVGDPELAARQMRQLLDARADRAAVLTSFLGALSNDDERILRDLLQQDGL
jgi:predicted transcriptional regulator